MTDGLSTLYQDLLGGSYDCVVGSFLTHTSAWDMIRVGSAAQHHGAVDPAAHILTQGTAIRSLMRNLGGSIGISVLVSELAQNTPIVHARLVERLRLQPAGARAVSSGTVQPIDARRDRCLALLAARQSARRRLYRSSRDSSLERASQERTRLRV